MTQFQTEAKNPENDERSTMEGIIIWRRRTVQVDKEGYVPDMRAF
jgi:hypothetical protein